jgi:hypothetical protein
MGKMRMRKAGVTGVLVACAATGTALAATGSTPRDGNYSATVTSAQRGKSALFGLTVIDHGRKAKDAALQCDGSGDPSQGIPAGTTVTVRIPRTLPISRGGTFSYSGTVKLTPQDTGSNVGGETSVVLKGKFVLHKAIKPNRTIAARGTVTVSLCAVSYQPKKFVLQYVSP